MAADIQMLETRPIKEGDKILHEGQELTAIQEFKQGRDAKQSGYKYFIKTPKGVMGLVWAVTL